MAARITFVFDFISPYAYLAHHQVWDVADRHGASVEPLPVVFAALLNAHGQLGPAEIPAKRVFVFKDALRQAHAIGRPLVPPPAHPFNPLLALRVASVPSLDHNARRAVLTALFDVAWGGQHDGARGLDDPEVVAAALEAAGQDPAAVLEVAVSPENKARLKAQTERALSASVFGVPTFLVEREGDAGAELFWGADRLGHVEAYLRGEDAFDPAALERWRGLPASAQRPQARGPETTS